jgi:transposase InsO family protein
MNHIFKLYGLPQAAVSDRDKVFTSNLWRELFKLLGSELHMSSAYQPQFDGQAERVNQCLETYLRCFIHAYPAKWSFWLSLAEFWYNTA